MKIYRENSFYRPLTLKGRVLNSIIFYRDGEILYQSVQGWLENGKHDITAIFIDEPKRALKVNLDRTDNFYLSVTSYSEKRYDLYIYVNDKDIKISEPVEIVGSANETETHYQYEHDIRIKALQQDWRLDSTGDKLEYFESEIQEFKIKTSPYHRCVNTPLGDKIEAILSELQGCGLDTLSKWDIERMLEKGFDIVKTE